MPDEELPFKLTHSEAARVQSAVLAAAATGVFTAGGPEGLARSLISAFALIARSTVPSVSEVKATS